MRKLKVLIEGNAPESVRLIEVVTTVPVARLIPALLEAMQLPQKDFFGQKLNYELRLAKDKQLIPPEVTLAEAGITLGARLILNTLEHDDSSSVVISSPSTQQVEQVTPGMHADIYTATTLTNPAQFSDPQYVQDRPYSDYPQRKNTSGLHTHIESKRPGIVGKKGQEPSRRTFLLAAGAICGVGGLGLGYATYRTPIDNEITSLFTKKPAALHPNTAQNVRVQSQLRSPTVAKLQFTFTKHNNIVRVAAWSPDGKLLASCSDDNHVFLWEMNGTVQQDILHPAGVRALAWSPDGQRIVTGAKNEVSFFNVQTGARLAHSTRRHTQLVTSLAWTAKNEMQVVSGGADKQAIIWNTQTYSSQTRYNQQSAGIDAVSWAADGQTVVSSSDDGRVHIWKAGDGKDVHGYYQDAQTPMRAVAFAPNGTQLAVGGDDGIIRIWDALTCKNDDQRCTDEPQRIQAAQKAIRALAWSPDGLFLAAGGNDGTFSIWNPRQPQKALLSVKQNDIVRSLTWSPDSKQIASAYGKSVTVLTLQ